MPTEPTPSEPDETIDAPIARHTAMEMAALTRVLFGVTTAPLPAPAELSPSPPPEAPAPIPERSIPAADIPLSQEVPAPPPVASPAPPPVVPASLPMPDVPLAAPVSDSADDSVEPAREAQRRPVGPSQELLQEIAFLEE